MFKLLSCSFGAVAVAILVTVVLILLMAILPQMLQKNQRFSSVSYLLLALFGVLVLSADIIFAGLVKTRNTIEDFQYSVEYRTMQYAEEALSTYAPNLHGMLEDVLGEDYTDLQLQRQIEAINKYLWIDGIVAAVLFVLGILFVALTMEGVPMRRAHAGRGDVGGRVHRSHEHTTRSRHRG